MAFQVELVSPERILFSGEADMVIARTLGGEIAFLTDHAPFIGTLATSRVRVRTTEGKEEVAAVHGGFVEVKDNRVVILSDVAELAGDIDANRAREALSRSEEQLRAAGDEEAKAEAEASRRRAEVRLEVAAG